MLINAAQLDENGLVINTVVVEEKDLLPDYKPTNLNIVPIPFANSTDGVVISYMPVRINETKYTNEQFVNDQNEPLVIDLHNIEYYEKTQNAWKTPPGVF